MLLLSYIFPFVSGYTSGHSLLLMLSAYSCAMESYIICLETPQRQENYSIWMMPTEFLSQAGPLSVNPHIFVNLFTFSEPFHLFQRQLSTVHLAERISTRIFCLLMSRKIRLWEFVSFSIFSLSGL